MSRFTPQELAFADEAPWTFDFEGLVTGTPAEVWAAFTDNESWTVWFANCRQCRATSEPFDGVGSTRYIRVNGLGVHERFIAWDPGQLWAFTVTDMTMPFADAMVERVRFQAVDDRHTRIDYRIAARPRWWAAPLRRVIAKQSAKAFAKSFARLDQYLAAARRGETGPDTRR